MKFVLTYLNLSLVVFLIQPFTPSVDASNILFFHAGATASHRTSIWPLATKLADVGHNITYIFSITKRPRSHPKIEELKPSKMIEITDTLVGDFDINYRLNNTVDAWLFYAFGRMVDICEAFYDSPETQEWLNRPNLHYDLVMIDAGYAQCAYPLVHMFKAKHVFFNPITLPNLWDTFGVVPETSSIPEFMFHVKPALLSTLWGRTLNTIAPFIFRWFLQGLIHKTEELARNKMNLTDMPSFDEIDRQTSLVFHNTYFIEDYPMSLPPMFVSYSGLLCTEQSRKERQSLPKDLEAFINDKDSDGFVYVSFGSSVVASAMPEDFRNHFMTAFESFPKLKFLWRWTGPAPENTPKNVLTRPWFPQLDVLAHPKIKAFVMQGGRPSAQEALYYGVPMVTIPIFGDQDFASDRLESIGAAIPLDIGALNAEDLSNAIKEVVYTKKYNSRVAKLSKMFRDRPMDPVDNALYWVEYVLRHDTSLMKPLAMHQTWWQRRLLDVYAGLLLVVLLSFTFIALIMYLTFKMTLRVLRQVVTKNEKGKLD